MGVLAIIVTLGIGVYGGAAIQEQHEVVDSKKEPKEPVTVTYNYNK
jgi:hypothetical protein